jgi:hypothetical protein
VRTSGCQCRPTYAAKSSSLARSTGLPDHSGSFRVHSFQRPASGARSSVPEGSSIALGPEAPREGGDHHGRSDEV